MDERETILLKEISRMTDEEFRALIERKKCEMEEKKNRKTLRNFIKLTGGFWPFCNHYMIVDVPEHYADQIFIRHGLPVKFGEEYYKKPDTGYVMVMLKVRKNREKDFLSSMEELKRKMILLGHTDYEEFCDNLWRGLGFKDEDVVALS